MQKKMYCKSLVIGIIVLFIGAGVYPSCGITIEKKPLMPTTRGNTLYVGGIGPNNYTKIQDAVDNASDGDTVFVYAYSSPYYEDVRVNKSINLIGEDRDTTIIDGGGYVVWVLANGVTVSGFTIREGSVGIYIGAPLSYGYNHNTITGNNISNNDYSGIYLWDSHSNTITENTISNNVRDGILLDSSDYNIIGENIISNNEERGIYLGGSSRNTIQKNNFIDNKRDAFFEIDSFIDVLLKRNQWNQNYWNRPRTIPKLIFGVLLGIIPWINIDWHPASEPYDI